MRVVVRWICLMCCVAGSGLCAVPNARAAEPASAQRIIIDMAKDHVDITTGFTGAHLTLFGVKRDAGDVALVVRGPQRPVVVRHKEQVFGMWMNTESVSFADVPSYYDLALSAREKDLLPLAVRQSYGLGLDSLDFHYQGREKPALVKRFEEALIRNKQTQGLFPLEARPVLFLNDDFFRADFDLPANLPTGDYRVQSFLIKDGAIIDRNEKILRVAQVGFSAQVRDFAYRQGLAYGLLAVILAIVSGGGAYYFMRRE